MQRSEYWNQQYFDYWQSRVNEANAGREDSTINPGDRATVGDQIIREQIALMNIQESDEVLDLGCGYGRLFPILLGQTKNVYGADISTAMIAAAQNAYGTLIKELRVEEAENGSYPNQCFDHVICWAVFDATDQAATVSEILRVLKPGGLALISGKANNYFDDDDQALVAEENARRKDHPNFFTDYQALSDALMKNGARIRIEKFFPRRGDLTVNRYAAMRPAHFYEFVVILQKCQHMENRSIPSFSTAYSLTWQRMRSEHTSKTSRTPAEC